MMASSESFLYRRMTKRQPGATGTLAEPEGTAEPRFALQSTVNWMHALGIQVRHHGITGPSMRAFYLSKNLQRFSGMTEPAANTVFEQLLMALHHLSALKAMSQAGRDQDLARVAIMSWYYGIYCAASAMIAAKDGSQQQDHTGTATQWDRQIAAMGLAVTPFDLRLTTLVEVDAKQEIQVLAGQHATSVNHLTVRASNASEAYAACLTYLSGTRQYHEWMVCENLLARELAKESLTNFRTSKARQLRDDRLRGKSLGFMHQAFRYRGKANYRDALFLTYEAQAVTVLNGFLDDLSTVLQAFVNMAGAFSAIRIGASDWQAFINDLDDHLNLLVKPSDVWP
ncbi:MAG: hypothetical protein HYZ18_07520 [Pseudogulbenkiania sp.]|nr:hypothetical protein [Pseudogulbenkiania sp.]